MGAYDLAERGSMIRGCALCQGSPSTKAVCCGQRLCATCLNKHPCPRAAELLAMTKEQAREFLSREDALQVGVVEALNRDAEIEMAWQSRKRGGIRANDAARAVADVTAVARGGIHVEVELKGSHKDDCPCRSCAAQRDRAERIRAVGGVYVGPVRSVREALDGVKMQLAHARGRMATLAAEGRNGEERSAR